MGVQTHKSPKIVVGFADWVFSFGHKAVFGITGKKCGNNFSNIIGGHELENEGANSRIHLSQ
jgi:hypothetical protein